MKTFYSDEYDVIVVGAGHAGAEAGLATARMGLNTLMLSMSLDAIVAMSCNPNIGGTGKGHLVREIDALGGEMAVNIDKTFIQSKMLNTSKGPAVHSLRVQADKREYHIEMKKVIENQENLHLREGEVVDIIIEDGEIKGVITKTGAIYSSKAVIIATGTYLRGVIHIGEVNYSSGPEGRAASTGLSENLEKKGFKLARMKTGTPARIHRDTIDFSKMEKQPGDEEMIPFSFLNIDKKYDIKQELCYLTYTTGEAHEIIGDNINRSPMYTGVIQAAGARYCPAIEDKIVSFPDRQRHQLFIEPEGSSTKEMYIQGASSTLPEEVQNEFYKHIIGLENGQIMRPAYGIEYDTIDPTILKRTLEHREIKNLFFAGQVNGTSGYEEAGAQGIIAGINAARNIKGKEPFTLDRSEAYIGVLIDDIVTKGVEEPYRIMTSRAEYRLSLRQDNADLRLTEKGYNLGLVTEERYKAMLQRKDALYNELERLRNIQLTPTKETNEIVESFNSTALTTGVSLYEFIKRPEIKYDDTIVFDPERPDLPKYIRLQIQTYIKYEGYIKKQMEQIKQFKKLENNLLDPEMDYSIVPHLRLESIQRLNEVKPESVGQASRISGVSPSDINMLLVFLEAEKRKSENNGK